MVYWLTLKLFHKSTKPHNHNVKEITIIEISDPNYLSQMFSAMILVKISQLPKTDEISWVLWLSKGNRGKASLVIPIFCEVQKP